MKKRRKFDQKYKQMVVELAETVGTISALAAEPNLQPDLIYRRRREDMALLVPASRARAIRCDFYNFVR